MAVFFNNECLKRLSGEQFKQLCELADVAQAETIGEQTEAEKEAMKNYIADLKKNESEEAARTAALVSSFV